MITHPALYLDGIPSVSTFSRRRSGLQAGVERQADRLTVASGKLRPSHHPPRTGPLYFGIAVRELLLVTHIGWESQVIGCHLSEVPLYLAKQVRIFALPLISEYSKVTIDGNHGTIPLSSQPDAWFSSH
jgi:hypothetical protein